MPKRYDFLIQLQNPRRNCPIGSKHKVSHGQIRSYHPWGYLLDEASFVVDAGECYNQALAVVKGKIILNSSAGPSWYADARHGIIRNAED